MIRVELIPQPSITVMNGTGTDGANVAIITTSGPSWMDPIIDFLAKEKLLSDTQEANRVRRTAPRYWLSTDRRLYRRSFGGPYLSCLHPDKVGELLAELHDGVCGGHAGGRSLAHRAMTQGFWWPRMQKDAAKYIRKCERCQKHAPLIHSPAGRLNPISASWPFAQWGLDILGPFP